MALLVAQQPYYTKGALFAGWLLYKKITLNQKMGKVQRWATKL